MARKRLPPTRPSVTHRVEIQDSRGGVYDLYVIVGFYPATRRKPAKAGELFLKTGKVGSAVRGMLDALGVQTSLLLQNGISLSEVAEKMQGMAFEPAGKTDNPTIPMCSSIVDYVFRYMRSLEVE